MQSRTIAQKIWDAHLVHREEGRPSHPPRLGGHAAIPTVKAWILPEVLKVEPPHIDESLAGPMAPDKCRFAP